MEIGGFIGDVEADADGLTAGVSTDIGESGADGGVGEKTGGKGATVGDGVEGGVAQVVKVDVCLSVAAFVGSAMGVGIAQFNTAGGGGGGGV